MVMRFVPQSVSDVSASPIDPFVYSEKKRRDVTLKETYELVTVVLRGHGRYLRRATLALSCGSYSYLSGIGLEDRFPGFTDTRLQRHSVGDFTVWEQDVDATRPSSEPERLRSSNAAGHLRGV